MRIFLSIGLLAATASGAMAQALTERQARDALFAPRNTTVAVSGELSTTDQEIVRRTIEILGQQLGGPVKFYASIAYSPDEGLLSEGLQSALNYHSPAGADAAATAACNAARASGTQPCRIAARVVPRGFEPRALTLSQDGTEMFRRAYRSADDPKAMAISEATGAFAMGAGADAALASCSADPRRPTDCRVVIAD